MFTELFKNKRQENFLKQAVDFYDLFSIIQELFQEIGILNEGDSVDPNKVSFKFSYPSEFYDESTENTVAFDLLERKLVIYNTSEGNVRQLRSHKINGYVDPVSGLEKELMAYFFQNKLQLYVYSTSSEKLYQILSTLESVLLKHREWFNKKYRVKIEYNGIISDASGHNLYHNRMFCKIICLTAYTEAQYEQHYETLDIIDAK